ncbi:MAG: response regulator, partial [Ruminiclostridium sp.]|nr:response regulator [Ruminiclostridium sp.]
MARKVLIVEDDSNIAELVNLYLKKEGYETMVAEDGGKALDLYRAFRPDLVLLDIMLPVMDGWTVCSKIRETDSTPIIMLTAKGETIDKVAGL